ncbi:MAG: radical SAM protein [Candidatus Peregrinibacteria bacterium]
MTSLKNRYRESEETKPKVVLMVNDKAACNMNCPCCYLPYEGVRDPSSVLRIIDNLQSQYRLSVAGSEVLADLRYLEALRMINQKYILTNGLLLSRQPQLLEKLQDCGIEEIQLSFDFKGEKGGRDPSNPIVRKAVQLAKERGFWVRLACIVTPDNYTQVDEMCSQVQSTGADAIFFIRYIQSGSAKSEGKETLTTEQRVEFFRLVDEERKNYQKSDLDIRMNGNFGPKKGSRGEAQSACNTYCFAGRTIFTVAPNDSIYGCPYLMDTTPIGKLIDESRLEIRRDLCDGQRTACLTDIIYG